MNYDINRPWLSLDPWQKKYIFDKVDKDNLLLTGRQVGKTTAMSMRAVELCVKHYKKGEFVLINSITEKQAYHMLAKAKVYAENRYGNQVIVKGREKATMHKLMFKNGTGILCYAAGETGEGQRGFTIKKLMCDEGSRMSEEYFIATMPMLSVIKGSMDMASTPYGKHHEDGTEKFFYKCSKDKSFTKYYVSGEDCPRHEKEFLEQQRERMTKLAYAQEYLAIFTDELKRLFDQKLINEICIIKAMDIKVIPDRRRYLGVDIAGFGKDENTFEAVQVITQRRNKIIIEQFHHAIQKRNFTTDTTKEIIKLNDKFDFKRIGVDDGGIGFGVYSELMNTDSTKRKTEALNNASRPLNKDGTKSKKLLKTEMYLNLLSLMENGEIKLLDNDELKNSLASIQFDEDKVFGYYSHVAEGIIRAVWMASQSKDLNIFAHTF